MTGRDGLFYVRTYAIHNGMKPFESLAPGRLCLFGEHQDYLGLPVIASALPLCCNIQVNPCRDSRILTLEWDACRRAIDLDNVPPRQIVKDGEPLDFTLSAVHEVLADGWSFVCGASCVSTTELPVQAGCSSSSAFCVAWVHALSRLCGRTLTRVELAQMAHKAEVVHFESPGGTMDHMTSALGGVLRIGPGMWQFQRLTFPSEGAWILAYSGEPKDTLGHLWRCKTQRLAILEKLGGSWDTNDSDTALTSDEVSLLETTRTNRDLRSESRNCLGHYFGLTVGGLDAAASRGTAQGALAQHSHA